MNLTTNKLIPTINITSTNNISTTFFSPPPDSHMTYLTLLNRMMKLLSEY